MGHFPVSVFDTSNVVTPSIQSVQSSLYQRLKRTHGKNAGTVGWLLVRASQPTHRHHADALAALSTLAPPALAALTSTVRAMLGAPTIAGRADSRELAQGIVEALEGVAALVDLGPVTPAGLADFLAAVRGAR